VERISLYDFLLNLLSDYPFRGCLYQSYLHLMMHNGMKLMDREEKYCFWSISYQVSCLENHVLKQPNAVIFCVLTINSPKFSFIFSSYPQSSDKTCFSFHRNLQQPHCSQQSSYLFRWITLFTVANGNCQYFQGPLSHLLDKSGTLFSISTIDVVDFAHTDLRGVRLPDEVKL